MTYRRNNRTVAPSFPDSFIPRFQQWEGLNQKKLWRCYRQLHCHLHPIVGLSGPTRAHDAAYPEPSSEQEPSHSSVSCVKYILELSTPMGLCWTAKRNKKTEKKALNLQNNQALIFFRNSLNLINLTAQIQKNIKREAWKRMFTLQNLFWQEPRRIPAQLPFQHGLGLQTK